MIRINHEACLFEDEIRVEFARSSGPGGQHVNRRATKARACLDVDGSPSLTEDHKARIREKLHRRLNSNGELCAACDETRSQTENRRRAVGKLANHLRRALRPEKPRKPTRIPKNQKRKRLADKRKRGETKRLRGKPGGDG
jgi:ribosome-associated protein